MLEVKVSNKQGIVDFNYEELKQQLSMELTKYKGLVMQDESQIEEFQSTRAILNKVGKSINDRKIEIKKEYCHPYDVFAEQTKELVDMISEVSLNIDDQVKVYETKAREKKKLEIEAHFKSLKFEKVDFEKLFQSSWLNKGCKKAKWKIDLEDKINKINADLDMIDLFSGTAEHIVLTKALYLETLDIGEAKKKADYQRELAEKINQSKIVQKPVTESTIEKTTSNLIESKEESEVRINFAVMVTPSQKEALLGYLKNNGIRFKKIGGQ